MNKGKPEKRDNKDKAAIAPKKKPVSEKKTSEKKTNEVLFYCIFLFVFSFVLYGQSLNYGYVLDDELITRLDKSVQEGVKGIPHIFTENTCLLFSAQGSYRPLLEAHLALEKEFWGFNPEVSHFFNAFYYGILGVLLFLVLCRVFKNAHRVFPFLITLLFLVHPVHTEVVANIKSRDEIFCFLFLLLSILFLFNYLGTTKMFWLIASTGSFFLACLSKETALTFLAVMPLLLFYFTDEKNKRISILTLTYAGIAAVFMVIRTVVNHGRVSNWAIDPLGNSLMAIHSHSERLATEIFILGKYIFLLFIPYRLVWDYSFNQIPPMGWSDIGVILSVLVCLGSLIFAFLKIKSRSVLGFCIFYFFITISITSNIIIPIGSTMAERFLFLPSLGFCILIVFLLSTLLKIDITGKSKHNYSLLYGISAALIFIYLLRTLSRESDWKDNLSLYEAGVKDAPNSARTHGALGGEYSFLALSTSDPVERASLDKKAIDELKISLNIYPKSDKSWYTLGATYFEAGDAADGEVASKNAILYNPNYAPAYYNLGTSQAKRNDFGEALENLKRAAALDSNYLEAFSNTASVYFYLGEYKNAAPYYGRCHELKPDSKDYYDRMMENEKRMTQDSSLRTQREQ